MYVVRTVCKMYSRPPDAGYKHSRYAHTLTQTGGGIPPSTCSGGGQTRLPALTIRALSRTRPPARQERPPPQWEALRIPTG